MEKPYRIMSLNFMRSYFVHMRPYLLFVSGAAGIAGMAYGASSDFPLWLFIFAFVPSFLGYGFGQALTDCFQMDTDKISSPYRPLVRGEVTPKDVMIMSFIGLTVIVFFLVITNWLNLIFGFLSVFGLATYTYFKKNFWYSGPFYNGWIVVCLPIMGYLSMSHADLSSLLDNKMAMLLFMTLFSYSNFVLMGYLKDISADRETGYRTFPVVFGWDKTTWIGDVFALLSTGLTLGCLLSIPHQTNWPYIFWGLGTLVAIVSQSHAHFTKSKIETNSTIAVAGTVRSFVLWHFAIALAFQPNWLLFAFIFYVLFEIVLYLRPQREQI